MNFICLSLTKKALRTAKACCIYPRDSYHQKNAFLEYRFFLLREVMPEPPDGYITKFKPGDIVTYTNEFGAVFPGKEVLGFTKQKSAFGGRFIYLANHAYWFPHKESELSTTVPGENNENI